MSLPLDDLGSQFVECGVEQQIQSMSVGVGSARAVSGAGLLHAHGLSFFCV